MRFVMSDASESIEYSGHFKITAVHISENLYNTRKIATLTPEQRIRLAKELYFKYKASKQQVRRILRLENSVLNELFPI